MKNILLIIISLFLFTGLAFTEQLEINTNTTLSISNIMVGVGDTKLIIGEWKEEVNFIKTNGLTLGTLISLILLGLATLTGCGWGLSISINLLQCIPKLRDNVKLQAFEDWVTKYLMKMPMTIISYFKTGVKKKP